MEDTGIDKLTKNLMADSSTTLTDPAFTDMVMYKVMLIERRKIIFRNILYFLIIMMASGAVIFFILKTLQQKITSLSSNLPGITGSLWVTVEKIMSWIQTNEFFIMPLIIILVLKSILDIIINRKTHVL
jgi:hypothetical protein